MPADESSPIPAALAHLTHADPLQGSEPPHLLAYLASVPDPRATRGRRHPLVAILGLAAAAVLAGARSIAAIAEWAADAPQPVRAALGARRDVPGHFAVPAEATIRRTLSRLDVDALAVAVGAWLADRDRGPGPAGAGRRRAVRSTARRCAAPTHPTATAARCTCWRRWTTPAARCWPNTKSAARRRRCPLSPRCWPHWTSPTSWSPPTPSRPTPRPPSSWSPASIQDTSRQGRYHNRRYAALARELGLEVAAQSPIGWSRTTVPEPTANCYAAQLAELAAALVLQRRLERRAGTATKARNLLACTCGCGRKVRR